MRINCPKCGRTIEVSEQQLYMTGNHVVCTSCASRLLVDGDYAYILNDKVSEKDFESRESDATVVDIRDPEVAALYDDAVNFIATCNAITPLMLQQYFDISAERAARLLQALEEQGVVGPYNGGAPRRILIPHNTMLPYGVRRRRGDALDQALQQMREARNGNVDDADPDAPRMRSYSCGCSTLSMILFGLLMLYFLIRMFSH